MTETLYRAWDLKKERMYYDNLDEINGHTLVTNKGVLQENKFTHQWDLANENLDIMVSTDYVDKLGRRIFEGDILHYQGGDYEIIWDKFKFNLRGFYNGAQFIPECAFSSFKYDEAEVASNKYIKMGMLEDI